MIFLKKALALLASGFIALSLASSVSAEMNPDAGGRPGLFKKFFEKAAIGTGTVTVKSGTTLTVSKNGKNITVETDSKTQFRRRFWGKSSLAEISVGDTVNVIGQWKDDSHTTVLATLVRDLSIMKRNGVFFGIITSLNSNGWVMHTKRGDETVTISSSTKLVNRKEVTITQSDIKVGDKVRVKGLWDKKLNTITEVTKVKDFSQPAK